MKNLVLSLMIVVTSSYASAGEFIPGPPCSLPECKCTIDGKPGHEGTLNGKSHCKADLVVGSDTTTSFVGTRKIKPKVDAKKTK